MGLNKGKEYFSAIKKCHANMSCLPLVLYNCFSNFYLNVCEVLTLSKTTEQKKRFIAILHIIIKHLQA